MFGVVGPFENLLKLWTFTEEKHTNVGKSHILIPSTTSSWKPMYIPFPPMTTLRYKCPRNGDRGGQQCWKTLRSSFSTPLTPPPRGPGRCTKDLAFILPTSPALIVGPGAMRPLAQIRTNAFSSGMSGQKQFRWSPRSRDERYRAP